MLHQLLVRPVGEAGSYLRLIDSCITQLKAQGPTRTCHESKEAEEVDENTLSALRADRFRVRMKQLEWFPGL